MEAAMEDWQVIDVICQDDGARRELLWLRAKEKGDAEVVALLEGVDPGLLERMRDVESSIRDEPDDRRRSAAYARAWDECFQRHAARLEQGSPQR